MKKALILYWHGLGDVIMLTPHLRHLYNNGYIVDLMCRKEIGGSGLLDDCPYTDKLIEVVNPWQSQMGFEKQVKDNISRFEELRSEYNWSGKATHFGVTGSKIKFNSRELGLEPEDLSTEVFIDKGVELRALEYVNASFPDGYIFVHTFNEMHRIHSWDATQWMKNNLPDLPNYNTHTMGRVDKNINFTFVIAREAIHRVLCCSVFAHACEAMDAIMDVVSYGAGVRYAWPLDQNKITHIREGGRWIKQKNI